jgi:steroid delta-isomerase-like uncharacterized protein
MAEQDLIGVARREVEAFNAGDWEQLAQTYTPDAVYDEPGTGRRVEGTDEIREVNRGWKAAFPDATGTITSVSASGNSVTVEVTWEGTQSGPLEGPQGELPPSNRRAVVRAVQILEFSDGRIKENRHYFDMLGMLQQLGAFEQMGAASA